MGATLRAPGKQGAPANNKEKRMAKHTVASDAKGMDRVSSGSTLAEREQALADLIRK